MMISCANVIETPTWYFAIYCRACSSDEARTRVFPVFVEAESTQRTNILLTEREASTLCPYCMTFKNTHCNPRHHNAHYCRTLIELDISGDGGENAHVHFVF